MSPFPFAARSRRRRALAVLGTMLGIAALLGGAAGALVACGSDAPAIDGDGDGGSGDDGGVGGEDTEDSPELFYAKGLCAFYEKCNPGSFRRSFFDSQDRCVELLLPQTKGALEAEGNEVERAELERCIEALGPTCDRSIDQVAECVFRGAKANGEGCSFAGQCASGSCQRAPTESCGKCAGTGQAGESCAEAECELGTLCSLDQKCAVPAEVGSVCSNAQPCKVLLDCVQGICTARTPVGGACNPSDAKSPLCGENLECVPSGAAGGPGTCQATVYAKLGEKCGRVAGGVREVACIGSSCVKPANGGEGTCTAFLPPGASCAAGGAECAVFSQCLEGTCVAKNLACK